MKGYVQDIESIAVKNEDFRQVLYTARNCQLVVMALKPKEEIGAEVHKLDQFFRVEAGAGEAVLDGVRTAIQAGFAVLVPAGTKHNIINLVRIWAAKAEAGEFDDDLAAASILQEYEARASVRSNALSASWRSRTSF